MMQVLRFKVPEYRFVNVCIRGYPHIHLYNINMKRLSFKLKFYELIYCTAGLCDVL